MTIAERILKICEMNEKNMSKFAERTGVTPAYISKLKNNVDAIPSDRFVTSVCMAYRVNEEWIKTGEGEMYRELTQEEELAEWIGRMQFDAIRGDKAAIFKQKLIASLSRINDDSVWESLYKMISALADNDKTE